MEWVKAKDLPSLQGIAMSCDKVNGEFKSITLEANNTVMKIVPGSYGGELFVWVPSPPPTKPMWRLTGTKDKLRVNQLFDSEYDARACGKSLLDEWEVLEIEVPEDMAPEGVKPADPF